MRAAMVLGLALAALAGCGKKSEPTEPMSSDQPSRTAAEPTKDSPPKPRGEPTATVSAINLFNEYLDNPLAADKKYKEKLVAVTGWGKVQRDGSFGFEVAVFPGMTQAQLARLSPRERQWFREGAYPPSVAAKLNAKGREVAAEHKPGADVRAVGFVVGPRKAEGWKDMVVDLDDCTLEVVPPKGK